ncbi:MAG: S41 family peptidase [Halanaerobiales bacterium]|nr:S41 family peptidase [Halanaerobiales bacterium]
MKKYSVAVIVVIITIIAVFSLISFGKEKEINFHNIISKVNQERKTILESETINDINQYTYSVTGNKEGFADEEIDTLLQPREVTQSMISREDALEDADYLFRLLKYVYGGYGYYGGDKVFDQAKQKVINSINKKDTLSIIDLKKIFLKHLSFITDGHMKIGRTFVNKKHVLEYYCNQQIEVSSNNQGFYYLVDNERRYIKSINCDNEVEKYLKLSINEDGELVYYIGLLQNDGNAMELLPIEYDLNSQINKDEIKLTKVERKIKQELTAFEEKTIEGIPILTCRKFHDQLEDNTLKYFVESGLKFKNEKVFIIDLRGNTGGSGLWSEFWFENYTGVIPHTGISSFKRFSKLYLYREKRKQNNEIGQFLEKYNMPKLNELVKNYYGSRSKAIGNKAYNTLEFDMARSKWVNNENIIFVLIDKGVASSAEDFVEQLKTLDNVVFVGSNTKGCTDIQDQLRVYLPNSNLSVYFGVGLVMIKQYPHFIDGVGYEPDLWLDNDDILERVIKLINRYDLK